METKIITIYMDGKIPIQVDEESFELIKMYVEEAGAHQDLRKIGSVIDDLVAQGWDRSYAREVCVMARST